MNNKLRNNARLHAIALRQGLPGLVLLLILLALAFFVKAD